MSSHFKIAGTLMLAASAAATSARPAKIDLAPKKPAISQPARSWGGAQDLIHQTKIQAPASKSAFESSTSCTDANGAEIKDSDPAFQRCTVDAQKTGAPGAAVKRNVGVKFGGN